MTVTLTIDLADARDLWQALLDRPHGEEWSDRVAVKLKTAVIDAEYYEMAGLNHDGMPR
jgi:hypothetical protein